MFYHFEELKVTSVLHKSRKKYYYFLRLLGSTEVTFEFLKMVKHNFGSVKGYLKKRF